MLALYLTLIDNEDDKRSFEDLYNQNRSKAYAIAFNILKNKTLAEEACSETFFSLAKSFQKIKNFCGRFSNTIFFDPIGRWNSRLSG